MHCRPLSLLLLAAALLTACASAGDRLNEARLFAPDVIAGRLATIEQEMLTELAANVADRLFDRVLSRVR
ncbi:MAG TPA: hypothetical protein DC060_00425 [Gemmatimonadetes bacterium]|nr:hypothetical protein [Gemmatimonadota bacterium]HBD96642.1 hypothetical protein [Gemmatimonadota bacterium]HIN51282.1 hypothetical protein [Gemmatimonadota bacterium]